MLLDQPGEFSLEQCDNCGLLYLTPRPTRKELRKHYPTDYHPFASAVEDETSFFERVVKRYGVLRRCRAITRRQQQGRLLDVGCSTGIFLNELRRHGQWEVYGVEPIESAAEFAQKRFGLQVFQGTLLDSNYPDEFFDVVTMWDVLEHVAKPSDNLREIHRILKRDGWLIIKVPNPRCWQARLFGSFWVGYDAPRHLFGYPKPTLTHKLDALGFDLIAIQSLAGGFYTFMESLGFWINAQGLENLGNISHHAAQSTLVRVASAPVFTLLRKLGLGSSLTYFTRKNSLRGNPYG